MAPTIQPIVHSHSSTTKQSFMLKRSPLKAKSRVLGEWTPSLFLTSFCLSHLSEMRIWSTKPETWDESSETWYRQFGLLNSPHRGRENTVPSWSTTNSVHLTLFITEVNARIKDPRADRSSSDKNTHERIYSHQQSTDVFVRVNGNRLHKQIQNRNQNQH